MNTIIIALLFSLGLSESIEARLPADPEMIYTVGFHHNGVKVGLDWKARAIVTDRVCRKTDAASRNACLSAALDWMNAECAYYGAITAPAPAQRDMQTAVCTGASQLRTRIDGTLANR